MSTQPPFEMLVISSKRSLNLSAPSEFRLMLQSPRDHFTIHERLPSSSMMLELVEAPLVSWALHAASSRMIDESPAELPDWTNGALSSNLDGKAAAGITVT